MKIENLERASRINDELAKLKLAKETLNNGGYVRIYSSARSSAGCVELDIANFNDEVNTCIDNHSHTLRGCIWIEALFTRWSSLWKNCKHSASCVFLFKLL